MEQIQTWTDADQWPLHGHPSSADLSPQECESAADVEF